MMLVYMMPVMALASAAKQNTSCMCTDFLGREHAINLGKSGEDVGLHIVRGSCVGLVPAHVSLVGSGGAQQMVPD